MGAAWSPSAMKIMRRPLTSPSRSSATAAGVSRSLSPTTTTVAIKRAQARGSGDAVARQVGNRDLDLGKAHFGARGQ